MKKNKGPLQLIIVALAIIIHNKTRINTSPCINFSDIYRLDETGEGTGKQLFNKKSHDIMRRS